jgi:hypothetical protein
MLPLRQEEGSLGLIDVLRERRLEREGRRRADARWEAWKREMRRRDAERREERELRRRDAERREPAERELRRREAVIREAAAASEAPEPESVVAQHASETWVQRECGSCGRRFHSYGQFLNHKCFDELQ